MPLRSINVSLAASKDLGLDVISTQVDWQVDVELGIQLNACVLLVNEPHHHRKICA